MPRWYRCDDAKIEPVLDMRTVSSVALVVLALVQRIDPAQHELLSIALPVPSPLPDAHSVCTAASMVAARWHVQQRLCVVGPSSMIFLLKQFNAEFQCRTSTTPRLLTWLGPILLPLIIPLPGGATSHRVQVAAHSVPDYIFAAVGCSMAPGQSVSSLLKQGNTSHFVWFALDVKNDHVYYGDGHHVPPSTIVTYGRLLRIMATTLRLVYRLSNASDCVSESPAVPAYPSLSAVRDALFSTYGVDKATNPLDSASLLHATHLFRAPFGKQYDSHSCGLAVVGATENLLRRVTQAMVVNPLATVDSIFKRLVLPGPPDDPTLYTFEPEGAAMRLRLQATENILKRLRFCTPVSSTAPAPFPQETAFSASTLQPDFPVSAAEPAPEPCAVAPACAAAPAVLAAALAAEMVAAVQVPMRPMSPTPSPAQHMVSADSAVSSSIGTIAPACRMSPTQPGPSPTPSLQLPAADSGQPSTAIQLTCVKRASASGRLPISEGNLARDGPGFDDLQSFKAAVRTAYPGLPVQFVGGARDGVTARCSLPDCQFFIRASIARIHQRQLGRPGPGVTDKHQKVNIVQSYLHTCTPDSGEVSHQQPREKKRRGLLAQLPSKSAT